MAFRTNKTIVVNLYYKGELDTPLVVTDESFGTDEEVSEEIDDLRKGLEQVVSSRFIKPSFMRIFTMSFRLKDLVAFDVYFKEADNK